VLGDDGNMNDEMLPSGLKKLNLGCNETVTDKGLSKLAGNLE
jgi:hypothetical protein